MKISAVYIAKNEGKNIARSLDSIKEAADELILVDTGSTDETVDIFKSYGGKVFYRKWDDDFSAPRNLALSKATGDWIIILDADESFSENTRQNIRGVLQSVSPEAKGLLINMINYDKDTGEALDEFYTLRIIRNIKGLNYKGRIHESLYIGDEGFSDMQRVSKELLSIDHTGYSASYSQEKNQRNLRLMLAAIEAGDSEERYYTSLYETYADMGDMDKALHYARLDVGRGRQDITYASRSYRGLMCHYAKDNSSAGKEKRAKFVKKAVEDFPELPDFHAEYSECLYQLGHYNEAKKEIEMAISLYKNYDGMEPCLLTPEMIPLMEKRRKEITALADKNEEIKISVCAIVKNEEKNICGWLKNVSVFADEIIINDTGSEDSTKELIARFSDENPDIPIVLLESDWQENFSYSKNQCLDEATGDWIVFTDADENFSEPESVRDLLCERDNTDTQVIFVPMANIDRDDNNRIINIFNVPRIFRHVAGLSYRGRIHEEITINEQGIDSLQTFLADNRLFMEHTGYSTSINPLKARRNLDLLFKDISEGENIQRKYQYLAECYYTLGDYDQALNNALLATQSPYQPLGHRGDMYWLALNSMEKMDYPLVDKMAVAENGIILFPQLPDFYGRKGMLLTENGNYQAALGCFEKSLELLEEYNKSSIPSESSNIMSVLHEIYADVGICLYKMGESEAAEAMFRTALTINPWTEKAICGWADVYNGQADEGFLAKLLCNYNGLGNYTVLLSSIFRGNGFPELAEYFGGKDGNAYIKVKSYPWIHDRSLKEMVEILPNLFVCLLEQYHEEYVKMLPEGLGKIVKYLHGRADETTVKGLYNDYKTFIKEVFMLASTEVMAKYIDMLPVLSNDESELEKNIIEVADILLRGGKSRQALDLYNLISADAVSVDGQFWQNVGICFYNLKQYEEARECFGRATKDEKTASYMTWCREVMGNER